MGKKKNKTNEVKTGMNFFQWLDTFISKGYDPEDLTKWPDEGGSGGSTDHYYPWAGDRSSSYGPMSICTSANFIQYGYVVFFKNIRTTEDVAVGDVVDIYCWTKGTEAQQHITVTAIESDAISGTLDGGASARLQCNLPAYVNTRLDGVSYIPFLTTGQLYEFTENTTSTYIPSIEELDLNNIDGAFLNRARVNVSADLTNIGYVQSTTEISATVGESATLECDSALTSNDSALVCLEQYNSGTGSGLMANSKTTIGAIKQAGSVQLSNYIGLGQIVATVTLSSNTFEVEITQKDAQYFGGSVRLVVIG